MSKIKVRTVVVPNVIVSACKLRSTYNGNYGLQYGAHLTGAGLSEVGLKEAQDGGHWYSTNAKYGSTNVMVDPVSIQDMEGNDIDADLENANINLTEPLIQCNQVPTIHRVIPSSWLDYNGHMNDSHYAEVFSKASDIILRRLGADAGYIARGYSYFTVDMKIDYLDECHAGDEISV